MSLSCSLRKFAERGGVAAGLLCFAAYSAAHNDDVEGFENAFFLSPTCRVHKVT